jgi:hypothetical protein
LVEVFLDRADLSLGVVVMMGWVGVGEKAGLAIVMPVLVGVGVVVEVDPSMAVLVVVMCLLVVTGAMERAVLGVQCLADVMQVPSLMMLATEGEVSRDLSCGGRDSAGLLNMSADEGDEVIVTISLPPWC